MDIRSMDRVLLEEKLNRLKAEDERVRSGREAAINWIRERLERELRADIAARFGLDDAQWRQFELGEEPAFTSAESKLLGFLRLTSSKARQYRAIASQGSRAAAGWLWKELVEHELRRLPARTEGEQRIPDVTWWRFLRLKVYSSAELAGKIAAALGLDAAEAAELGALFLRDVFEDVGPLKEAIRKGIKARGMTITAFREDAYIGQTTWVPFEPGGKGTVSQDTLLKLIIGLRLTPDGAWDFLAPVHSGFYMECDLVFLVYMYLICARSGPEQYVPEELAELIQRYSHDGRRLLFGNPYPPEAYSHGR